MTKRLTVVLLLITLPVLFLNISACDCLAGTVEETTKSCHIKNESSGSSSNMSCHRTGEIGDTSASDDQETSCCGHCQSVTQADLPPVTFFYFPAEPHSAQSSFSDPTGAPILRAVHSIIPDPPPLRLARGPSDKPFLHTGIPLYLANQILLI